MNISDNVMHLIQLIVLMTTMCVLIIFAPSLPAIEILTAFAPAASILIGAKINQTATNAAISATVPTAPAPQNGPPTQKGSI